jgi:WD and tetratricopeptide repeat-containing protein 1
VGSPAATAGDGKVNNGIDDKAGTSSESASDSDSDSDSSDSGSDSGSQSRSAAESGSGSSSDSDSDASSSSKEGSDAFVDITSDDDKGNTAQTKVGDDLNLSSPPRDLTRLDVDDEQIDIGTNMDYRTTSPHIDLNNFNTHDDDDAEATDNVKNPSEIPGSKNIPSTRMEPTHDDSKYNEMSYEDDLFDDSLRTISENLPDEEAGQFTKQHANRRKSTSKDGLNHGPMSTTDRNVKPKLKRPSGNENSTAKPESAKKVKVDAASPGITGSFSEPKKSLVPEKHMNDRSNKETGSVSRIASRDSSPAMKGRPLASGNIQKIDQSPNLPIPTTHSERPKENIEKSSLKKRTDKMQKPWHGTDGDFGTHGDGHHASFDGSDDSSTRKRSRHGDSLIDDKMLKRSKDANANINSMSLTKTSTGNAGPDEITTFPQPNQSNGELPSSQRGNFERSPHGNKKLQRELSDLELGELRESSLDNDNGRTRKQFERNSSSKSLDGKLTDTNNSYPSTNNRKVHLTGFHDKGKPSPQEYGIGGHINQEAFPRKAGYDFDDNRPQQRGNVPENQHFSRADYSDSENISYRPGDKTSKKESRVAQGGMLEYPDMKKKTTSRLPQNGSNNAIMPRAQKSLSPSDNEERSRNNSLVESETGRKRESSSDDDNLFFSKYDKDEPELKAPIKDFSQ